MRNVFDPTIIGTTVTLHGSNYVVSNVVSNGTSTNGIRLYPIIQGGDGTEDPKPEGDGDGTGSDNSDGTPPATGDGEGEPKDDEKKFTQKEVNDLITRETSKATRGKLDPKEFGFNSRKELDEFVATAKERDEASKTESDKKFEEAVKEAVTKAETDILSKADKRLVRAEFLIAAHGAHVQHADDAFVIAQTLDVWDQVEVDKDGNVAGFDEHFFEELKEKKAFLFEAPSDAGDIGAGNRGGKDNGNSPEQLMKTYPSLASRLTGKPNN